METTSPPITLLDTQPQSLGTEKPPHHDGSAYRALQITQYDTVIETEDGYRLPGVPLYEAKELNELRGTVEHSPSASNSTDPSRLRFRDQARSDGSSPIRKRPKILDGVNMSNEASGDDGGGGGGTGGVTNIEKAPTHTNPLFPPLPVYGPPTPFRRIQCMIFRATSGVLSLCFLAVVVMGAFTMSIPIVSRDIWCRLHGKDPDALRPFYEIEKDRARKRKDDERQWKRARRDSNTYCGERDIEIGERGEANKKLTGGKDMLVCDVRYYAQRVGLEVEKFQVETEDGFLLDLQHVFDPDDPPFYPDSEQDGNEPRDGMASGIPAGVPRERKRKYPVLLMHGLLQSSGAFCVNDEDSLAFYLCKSGYDVWLGNNRCGFNPQHTVLDYSDPRMWAWNIRQMGILDLPALIDHVLNTTRFSKLGLVCHSQGTTETFVALAKQQRPDLGEKISIFCALAPAVYAGPLIDKFHFKFMKIISPAMFRIVFGIHAFIPFMMTMHSSISARIYGGMGYKVFWFLFGWSDERWDRGLKDRFFQFAPVYVSAESMRWWLGRECFARHKCILATRKEEMEDDEEGEGYVEAPPRGRGYTPLPTRDETRTPSSSPDGDDSSSMGDRSREEKAWYDKRCPPIALWIAGADDLVDGKRLLRRFERGKEPCVNLVHAKSIESYEHLDVIWAIDAVEQVHKEVREWLWWSVDEEVRKGLVVPEGV
ncbi:hypothetical protein RUND412_002747 [Rhizina undulata]